MRRLFTLFTLGLSVLLTGCEEEAITSKSMKTGEQLYLYYCQDCHERKGPGARMERLAGKEPMKPYKVILLIKYGYNARHDMPAFREFTDEQAALLAQHVVNMQLENNKKLN